MLLAIVRDVTERRRDTVKFRGVVESADDAAVGVDPGGNIALANPQAEKLFGYLHGELIDQPVDTLVPQVSRDLLSGAARGTSATRRTVRLCDLCTWQADERDGSEFRLRSPFSD